MLSKLFRTGALVFLTLFFHSDQMKANSALKEGCKGSSSDHIAAHTFTFRELAAATKNFRADCFVGEGGFGQVYRGHLESTNQVHPNFYHFI